MVTLIPLDLITLDYLQMESIENVATSKVSLGFPSSYQWVFSKATDTETLFVS